MAHGRSPRFRQGSCPLPLVPLQRGHHRCRGWGSRVGGGCPRLPGPRSTRSSRRSVAWSGGHPPRLGPRFGSPRGRRRRGGPGIFRAAFTSRGLPSTPFPARSRPCSVRACMRSGAPWGGLRTWRSASAAAASGSCFSPPGRPRREAPWARPAKRTSVPSRTSSSVGWGAVWWVPWNGAARRPSLITSMCPPLRPIRLLRWPRRANESAAAMGEGTTGCRCA